MGRRKPATTHGVTVVDKPAGMTSHDVVALLRRRFGERQIGHAGTLDPDATGVLVVGVGMATRLLRFVVDSRKRYVGEVVLGTETSTLDAGGEVTAVHDMGGVGVDDARRVVAEHLTGDILQVPPMVSALKVGGRRSARAGTRGHRGRARGRARSRCSGSTCPKARRPACSASMSSARRVRTSARSPPISVACSAAERICAICGASRWGRSRSTRRRRPTSCVLLPVAAAVRSLAPRHGRRRRRRVGGQRPSARGVAGGRTVGGVRPPRHLARGLRAVPRARGQAVRRAPGAGCRVASPPCVSSPI